MELFAHIQQETKIHSFQRLHRLITIHDQDLGDLISIEYQPNGMVKIEVRLLDMISTKQLGQGDLYINTKVNSSFLALRNKKIANIE